MTSRDLKDTSITNNGIEKIASNNKKVGQIQLYN
jgi:hypothetical protein